MTLYKTEPLNSDLGGRKEKEDSSVVRVIDGGGQGFRRADVGQDNYISGVVVIGSQHSVDSLLDFAISDLRPNTEGIDYCMAGAIENNSRVVKSPNIPMINGTDLGSLTTKKSGLPSFVCNDMDGAVIGMAELLPELEYFMGTTWSSGIGARVYRQGAIITPHAEAGHIPLDPSPYAFLCGCGLRGCVESSAGGESVKRRVMVECEALGIKIPPDRGPCAFLDESFDRKEQWAIDIYNLFSEAMATFLATIQTIFVLPAVVWKGTFAEHVLPRIEKDIRGRLRRKLMNPEWERRMVFYYSPDPWHDSLIGAASLFRKHLESGKKT